jgi:hypothetical protein
MTPPNASNASAPAEAATVPHPGPTQFPELNELLRELSERAAGILGGNFVGAYLQGSFAVGDADLQSDCDFLIPVHGPITQQALDDRRLGWDPHAPPRPGSVEQTLAFLQYVHCRVGVEPGSR